MLRLLIAFIFCMVGLFQPDATSCVSKSGIASEFDVHAICDKTTRTSFTPMAKVTDGERYTIVHDCLGTPTQAYDSEGNLVWEMLLDVYGEVMECRGDRSLVPFRYQGQYEDSETGLYYNRFRYYSPEMGMYISSDPIGLAGNNPTFYGYVQDVNTWLDLWGLCGKHGHHSDPKFMGGDPKQSLTKMPSSDHIELHKDMNTYLETKIKVVDDTTVSMRPKRGNSGTIIRSNFSREERLKALAEFYSTNTDKYSEASKDFFSQHPNLKKTGCK